MPKINSYMDREEVDGECICQRNLPMTFQVDRRIVVISFNCSNVSDILTECFPITEMADGKNNC